MTKDQEHIITMLFVKYGGFEAVVDMWLYSDSDLNEAERTAIDAWLTSERIRPYNLKVSKPTKNNKYQYLTTEISINLPEKD